MNEIWKNSLLSQFNAAIKMLENAITACPDDVWQTAVGQQPYWYVAYHALFWLDLYLGGTAEGFAPPAPFNLDELDPAGVYPSRIYAPTELLAYLEHNQQKCRGVISGLTDDNAARLCRFPSGEICFLELLLDNLRHLQGHAAELLITLGTKTGSAPRYVTKPPEANQRKENL
jgi:hypothetical protein